MDLQRLVSSKVRVVAVTAPDKSPKSMEHHARSQCSKARGQRAGEVAEGDGGAWCGCCAKAPTMRPAKAERKWRWRYLQTGWRSVAHVVTMLMACGLVSARCGRAVDCPSSSLEGGRLCSLLGYGPTFGWYARLVAGEAQATSQNAVALPMKAIVKISRPAVGEVCTAVMTALAQLREAIGRVHCTHGLKR